MLGAVVPMSEVEPGCHLGSGCGFPAPDASIFEVEPYFGNFTKPVFLLLLGSLLIIIFFLVAFRRAATDPEQGPEPRGDGLPFHPRWHQPVR